MAGRFLVMFILGIFLSISNTVNAQDLNYNTHKKYFFLCSYKKECSNCESCTKEVYRVKIKNNTDKKIKSIYYQFYSPVYEKNITREAVIEGDQVEKNDIGYLSICVRNKIHWAITKIVYTDDSEVTFVVDGPLKTYIQEPDECSCNIMQKELNY